MVEAGTLCTNADVVKKAGLNANSTASAEAYTNVFILQAEAFFSVNAKYDFVANYASLPTNMKEFLRDGVSSYAAIMVINYDMSGYTSRVEAQVMLDLNWSIVVEVINLLRDDKFRTFVQKGNTG